MEITKILEDAWKARNEGDYNTCLQLVQQAEAICDPEDLERLGRIQHIHMQFHFDKDLYNEALNYSRKSVDLYQKSGNQDRIAHSTRHMADLELELGWLEDAKAHYETALSIYRQMNPIPIRDLINCITHYAVLMEKMGRKEIALVCWSEAFAFYTQVEFEEGIKEAEENVNRLKG